MSSTRIGAALTGFGFEIDQSPNITRSTAGDVVERLFDINTVDFKAASDALVLGTPDVVFTTATLQEVKFEGSTGDTGRATLTFQPESFNFEILPPVGTVILESDANAIEIPIRRNDTISSDADIEDALDKGIEARLSPQPIFRRTEVLASFTFTEANIIDDVGVIDNSPNGIVAPTAGLWLKTGFVVRSVGDLFEQTETWQFAENGWNDGITLYNTIA